MVCNLAKGYRDALTATVQSKRVRLVFINDEGRPHCRENRAILLVPLAAAATWGVACAFLCLLYPFCHISLGFLSKSVCK